MSCITDILSGILIKKKAMAHPQSEQITKACPLKLHNFVGNSQILHVPVNYSGIW
jgi:hypothetical protein